MAEALPNSFVFPEWAQELVDLYLSGTTCTFILHGNVHDLLHCPTPQQPDQFLTLTDFLATQLFGGWDLVLGYDLARGLKPITGGDQPRHREMMNYLTGKMGPQINWPREPDKVLSVVDQLAERNLMDASVKQMCFVFPYAQFLMPSGDLNSLSGGRASRLVRLLGWAQNPYFKKINTAFFLIADSLPEINDRLVQSPHVATIDVPLPSAESRRVFIRKSLGEQAESKLEGLDVEGLTQLSNGLNLVSLNVVLSGGGDDKLGPDRFGELKKTMIERQCRGLVTFVEPEHTLEMVVGHTAAKARLRQDGKFIEQGRLDAAPMGYLLCGPVGTGKTFLAECFAGSIGIPCVVLKNFRSKYVGETEGNLEHVLNVLRSLGPVVVIIDEADAALGDRQSGGDSGTSGRVFSMIASQMGNTRYRGRIIWMLLTSRPDLLPIDLKRQGRAEVHIPLFYPDEDDELAQMFRVMARKNKVPLADDAIPAVSAKRELSGADVESIMLAARRSALTAGDATVTREHLETALASFIPSAQGLEKTRQEICAVLECTDMSFLPPAWREEVQREDGRTLLQREAQRIKRMLHAEE
ncbi:MAG: ATP-binding protein [Planctomycetales bacterium]|nr:ATP-binding protein [Planctomycetales bacterium]